LSARDGSLRLVVTGLLAQHPRLGGIGWHYLQYAVGLARLGHDVYYFEDSGETPYTLDGGPTGKDWVARDCSENVSYLASLMDRFGLEGRWAYRCPGEGWFGLGERERAEILRSADALINVSGSLEKVEPYRGIRRLVYIDTDPVVTQIRIAAGRAAFRARVDGHDVHFSFGECLGSAVPETGHRWRPTRQPIVLSEWDVAPSAGDAYTTIMNWTSYEKLTHDGQEYGQKDVEFRRFLTLPGEVAPVRMQVALSGTRHHEWEEEGHGEAGPHELIERAGWNVVDAYARCSDLDSYRDFIRGSRAEWSVAKNVYVRARPGWFSERSACYLAAGRPVVVQDTGFGGALPVGDGLLAFTTPAEAVEAIRSVEADYPRHRTAARAVAEECFDSGKVLTRLLDEALGSDGPDG